MPDFVPVERVRQILGRNVGFDAFVVFNHAAEFDDHPAAAVDGGHRRIGHRLRITVAVALRLAPLIEHVNLVGAGVVAGAVPVGEGIRLIAVAPAGVLTPQRVGVGGAGDPVLADDQRLLGVDQHRARPHVAQAEDAGVVPGEFRMAGAHDALADIDLAAAAFGADDDFAVGAGVEDAAVGHAGRPGLTGIERGEVDGELAAIAEVVQRHLAAGADQPDLIGVDGAGIVDMPGDERRALGIDGAQVLHRGVGVALEDQVAIPEVVVGNVEGGGDEPVDVDLRPGSEKDAVGIDQIEMAVGSQLAVDLGGVGANHPRQHRRPRTGLVDVDLVAVADVKALPIDNRLAGLLMDIHHLAGGVDENLPPDNLGAGRQVAGGCAHRGEEHHRAQER